MTNPEEEDFIVGVIVIGLAIIALIAVAFAMPGTGTPRESSTYTGYVVDVEYEKGYIFENTKVLMKTHPRSSEHEEFCVIVPDDREIVETARTALVNQTRVTVEYSRPLYVNPMHCFYDHSLVRTMETANGTRT